MNETSSTELEARSNGVASATQGGLERLAQANDIIERGDPDEIVDVLLYTDVLLTVSREKQAADVARESARVRILAVRRLGEILLACKAEERRRLGALIPSRFGRCAEVAEIPPRLFKESVDQSIENDGTCDPSWVLRRARVRSLKRVENDIYVAYDGSYWITGKGQFRRTEVGRGGLAEARHRLGLRNHPKAPGIDDAYAKARQAATTLSIIRCSLTGKPARLVGQAELLQAQIAELLDEALRALTS